MTFYVKREQKHGLHAYGEERSQPIPDDPKGGGGWLMRFTTGQRVVGHSTKFMKICAIVLAGMYVHVYVCVI